MKSGARKSALREFAADDPIFAGHFPGAPIVPGVALLEAVLDSAREILGSSPTFCGVERVKFLRPLGPHEAYHVELRAFGESVYEFSCIAYGQRIATGRLRMRADRA